MLLDLMWGLGCTLPVAFQLLVTNPLNGVAEPFAALIGKSAAESVVAPREDATLKCQAGMRQQQQHITSCK
jgi:hypothetical protein